MSHNLKLYRIFWILILVLSISVSSCKEQKPLEEDSIFLFFEYQGEDIVSVIAVVESDSLKADNIYYKNYFRHTEGTTYDCSRVFTLKNTLESAFTK